MRTDQSYLRQLARTLKHTKADLHRVAYEIYHTERYKVHIDSTWDNWIKHALKDLCSPHDISTIKYTAIVLDRLSHRQVRLNGEVLTPEFFLAQRLSYLHDALGTLNHLSDGAVFDEVMLAVATLGRDNLRNLLDGLNFRRKDRPLCSHRTHAGITTYLIVCTSDVQAAAMRTRLTPVVYMQR